MYHPPLAAALSLPDPATASKTHLPSTSVATRVTAAPPPAPGAWVMTLPDRPSFRRLLVSRSAVVLLAEPDCSPCAPAPFLLRCGMGPACPPPLLLPPELCTLPLQDADEREEPLRMSRAQNDVSRGADAARPS